jgi:putrescine---pyruvate transaminase
MPQIREGFGPGLEDVIRVPHDDLAAAERAFEQAGDRVAAVIAEPVIAGGGVHPPAPGYLQGLRRLCDRHGAFLIADEVVCGFGRLGTWWGSERYGVTPDVITFAKAVTSGYLPLGGVLLGPAVRAPLEADEDFLLAHGHTYSGHPAPCAAALAALDITEREGLPARALEIGAWIQSALATLAADDVIAGYRGAGAMWGAVLHEDVSGFAVHRALVERGVIVRVIKNSIVGLCPPLVASRSDIEACADVLRDAIGAVRGSAMSHAARQVPK